MNHMTTPWTPTEIPWDVYPRPQLRRKGWINLNGQWDFARGNDIRKMEGGLKITVPFPQESLLSGLGTEGLSYPYMKYSRTLPELELAENERLILHIGATDQEVGVSIGGIFFHEKRPYIPLSFDITMGYGISRDIEIVVKDKLDRDYPYGKQRKNHKGMWYTPVSGIWQTVWLEIVPKEHIKSLRITPDLKGVDIIVEGGAEEKLLTYMDEDSMKVLEFTGDHCRIDIEKPHLWSPEDPHLYDFSIVCGKDKVESYFGLRTVSISDDGRDILLNGEPYFFHGLLDQGYFSDGIFLPASPEGYEFDILTMKDLGFNTLRKHIKLEPEIFYYYCDRLGMVVFQDFINNGPYSYIVDTALPNVGPRKGITHYASKKRRELFENCAEDMMTCLYSHPSVCYYTIFNEGWGQYDADKMYEKFVALDPTRIYDTTSGWFKERLSDVQSEHIYFKPVKIKATDGKPLVLSEFGGYSCKIPEHSYNLDKTYGYRYYTDTAEFQKAITELYENEIVPCLEDEGLCAAILTQVSDVEDETNGLVTYDRKVVKVDRDEMRRIAEKLRK